MIAGNHCVMGGFSIFYAVSSGGILLTQIVSSLILQTYGWTPLYLTLAVAGLLGIASFLLSYRHYRSVDSAQAQPEFHSAKPADKSLTASDKKRITSILILAVFSIIFWMGCSQMGSSVFSFPKTLSIDIFLDSRFRLLFCFHFLRCRSS